MEVQNTHISTPKKPPAAVFLSATLVIFFFTFLAADSVGFVPSYIDGSASFDGAQYKSFTAGGTDSKITLSNLPELGNSLSAESASQSAESAIVPERIVIPAIGMNLPIQNPATKNIDELTEVLKAGPARYVDSAKLGEKGNMLVFGHSSRLPVVRNQMYKAFNNISDLKTGDTISVFGGSSTSLTTGGKEYLYSVTSVREGDANEDVIDLSRDKGTRITLVTCNTLGEKSARWIVEAEFIGTTSSSL